MAREMKDSGVEWIGEIPRDWKIVRTKNKYYFHKNIVGNQADHYQRLALTLNGVIKRDKEDSSGLQPETFTDYQVLSEGELVFKLIDLKNISTSRVGYSPYVGLVSPAYIILSPKEKENSKYGEYFFLSMWQREIFNHMGDDGVRSSLNSSDLLNIAYIEMTYEEQTNIVQFLNEKCLEIDNILSKTRASIEEYKKLKQAIITQAVTKGIRGKREMKDSGIEWVGDIPKEWRVEKLRYLGVCQNGISKSSDYFGEGFPFVSYGDVYRNYQLPEYVSGLIKSTDDDRVNYSVRRGDVFFTRTSETIEEVGFSSVCLKTIENATFAGFIIRFRPNSDELLPEYSKYYFRSDMHRRFFVKEMNLVTRASLGQELLKKMPIIIPSFQEQMEIAAYLEKQCGEIDNIIMKKERYITELGNYKKSLIYEYVTGKKEVPQKYQV